MSLSGLTASAHLRSRPRPRGWRIGSTKRRLVPRGHQPEGGGDTQIQERRKAGRSRTPPSTWDDPTQDDLQAGPVSVLGFRAGARGPTARFPAQEPLLPMHLRRRSLGAAPPHCPPIPTPEASRAPQVLAADPGPVLGFASHAPAGGGVLCNVRFTTKITVLLTSMER